MKKKDYFTDWSSHLEATGCLSELVFSLRKCFSFRELKILIKILDRIRKEAERLEDLEFGTKKGRSK